MWFTRCLPGFLEELRHEGMICSRIARLNRAEGDQVPGIGVSVHGSSKVGFYFSRYIFDEPNIHLERATQQMDKLEHYELTAVATRATMGAGTSGSLSVPGRDVVKRLHWRMPREPCLVKKYSFMMAAMIGCQ